MLIDKSIRKAIEKPLKECQCLKEYLKSQGFDKFNEEATLINSIQASILVPKQIGNLSKKAIITLSNELAKNPFLKLDDYLTKSQKQIVKADLKKNQVFKDYCKKMMKIRSLRSADDYFSYIKKQLGLTDPDMDILRNYLKLHLLFEFDSDKKPVLR